MRTIKQIPVKDYDRFCDIAANAYTAFNWQNESEGAKLKKNMITARRFKAVHSYGAYESGKLLGGLRLFDFPGMLFDQKILFGGGGFLAVDLLRKKEKVARDLVLYMIKFFLKKKAPIAVLYPFRPDFYRQMGFGYGSKINEYIVRPADLPSVGGKNHLVHLTMKSLKQVIACYDRVASITHGMFFKSEYELARYKDPSVRIIGYKKGQQLKGFMAYSFKSLGGDNFLLNDLVVREMVYEDREVLAEFMTFLNSQADQVRRVVFVSSDDQFHFLPHDPCDDSDKFVGPIASQTNRQGIGLMYRVIDVNELFKQLKKHSFADMNLKLKLNIYDSFLPENDGSYLIEFENGRPKIKKSGEAEIEISLKIEDFSSLLMGTVSFEKLYNYNLADISDAGEVRKITRLFAVERQPICYTQF